MESVRTELRPYLEGAAAAGGGVTAGVIRRTPLTSWGSLLLALPLALMSLESTGLWPVPQPVTTPCSGGRYTRAGSLALLRRPGITWLLDAPLLTQRGHSLLPVTWSLTSGTASAPETIRKLMLVKAWTQGPGPPCLSAQLSDWRSMDLCARCCEETVDAALVLPCGS